MSNKSRSRSRSRSRIMFQEGMAQRQEERGLAITERIIGSLNRSLHLLCFDDSSPRSRTEVATQLSSTIRS